MYPPNATNMRRIVSILPSHHQRVGRANFTPADVRCLAASAVAPSHFGAGAAQLRQVRLAREPLPVRVLFDLSEIIEVVEANNAHSLRTGVPPLEIGIGICFQDRAPLLLFDDEKPIVISPAIGDADRLSSCSWELRNKRQPSAFNVDVCRFAADASDMGEKGQKHTRYNVNGILLDAIAFKKLQSEITLARVVVDIEGAGETFFLGQSPDIHNKKRDLVIRRAPSKLWTGKAITPDPDPEYFYEVISQKQVLSKVLHR